MAAKPAPVRVLLAKLGLDGHDRGIKVVARILRDAGMEVIYLGLRQTTASIVAAAEQEDADVIGLSMHNAGHLTLAPAMLAALSDAELDIPLVIGGIIPDQDLAALTEAGVAAVLGPGASAEQVVGAVRSAIDRSAIDRDVSLRTLDPPALLARAIGGDRRAVGRLLTMVERGGEVAEHIAELCAELRTAESSAPHVVGITGAPGAGKSTLVGRLLQALVERGATPGVLAVDPSSPLTGGAILGDRVRMTDVDHVAFIRSFATRGHAGGLALAIPGAVRVLEAAGFDPVVIETVGVGQVEVEIAATADTTVVVVTPGMGDAVQANKAGLLEVGDVFVVNKADRPGASDARRDLELMLELSHVSGAEGDRRPPIVMTDSLDGEGVAELLAAVEAHRDYLDATGERHERRRRRAELEIVSRVGSRFDARLVACMGEPEQRRLIDEVAAGLVSGVEAARRVERLIVRE